MRRYTAIVVEDEELPRLSLLQKIATYHPDIDVVDSCGDCDTAIVSILKHRPDMLFLDIQLPERDSLWLIEQLRSVSSTPLPPIVFTTSFRDPEYLLKAIRCSASDYLIKPVDIVELSQAIRKIKERLDSDRQVPDAEREERKYTFRTYNSLLVAKDNDILYFVADGNYCSLILLNGRREEIFERLGDVERKISDNPIFMRLGRSHIINKKYIYKIDTKQNICCLINNESDVLELSVSQKSIDDLIDKIGDRYKESNINLL